MKARLLTVFILAVGLALALAWAVAAQGPEPLVAPQRGVPTPQPLSFRYLQTFGESEVAYFDDPDHLNEPTGVGTDGTNVWIVERSGRRALKYTSDGTFVMQIGKAGFKYVAGTIINSLTDVAVDSSSNVWLVDTGAHHVVKFNSSGSRVSELGVTYNPGAGNDRFKEPYSIAFDSAGNIYVSDSGNQRIQAFSSSGAYSTTIGVTSVPGSDNTHFNNPRHIAVDSNNRLYVADANNHRVQIFDVSSVSAITYVGTIGISGESGSDNAHLNTPEGVAVDVAQGRIYVADASNCRVQVFDYDTWTYQTTLDVRYSYIADVAVDAEGNLFVAEPWSDWSQVRQFDSALHYVRTYGAKGIPYLTDGYHYNQPYGVAVASDGSIYIGEGWGKRLVKLNAAGVPQWIIGEAGIWGNDNEHFSHVSDVALDEAGRVYAADAGNCRVQIYNPDGSYYATLGSGCGTGDNQFSHGLGLTVAFNGNIYVADASNNRVQIFSSDRVYLATLGETSAAGSDNAHFDSPEDVAVDWDGNLYVVDGGNHRVQVFDSSRAYLRTIGVTGNCSYYRSYFCSPTGITVDTAGRIYVADRWGSRIQVLDSSYTYLTTIAPSEGTRSGELRGAEGLAVDQVGNLYVADRENHRTLKFAPGVPEWQPWSAGFETGDFTEWSYVQGPDPNQGGPGPQYVYVSTASAEGIPPHGGSWVAHFERPAGTPAYPHAKVYKEWSVVGKWDQFGRIEERLPNDGNPSGIYRAWYYYPRDYQATGGWAISFQFKEEGIIQGVSYHQPSWYMITAPAATLGVGGNEPVLFVYHWNYDDPSFHPKWLPVPLGRWFEIRADLYDGVRIDWYVDGQLFDQSYNSEYPVGRFFDESNVWIFGVGHYLGIGKLWVDDASFTPFLYSVYLPIVLRGFSQ